MHVLFLKIYYDMYPQIAKLNVQDICTVTLGGLMFVIMPHVHRPSSSAMGYWCCSSAYTLLLVGCECGDWQSNCLTPSYLDAPLIGSLIVHRMGHTAQISSKYLSLCSVITNWKAVSPKNPTCRQAIKGKLPLCLSTVLAVYRDMEVKQYMVYRGQFLYLMGKDLLCALDRRLLKSRNQPGFNHEETICSLCLLRIESWLFSPQPSS